MEIADLVEVVPFWGFGAARLGMTKDMIRSLLGQPDAVSTDPDGDAALGYERLGVRCTFYAADDGALGSFTFNTDRFIAGNRLVGVCTERLVELGRLGVLPGVSLEQVWPELGSCNYDCEALGLSFWVRENRVQNWTLYPRYDESGQFPFFPSG